MTKIEEKISKAAENYANSLHESGMYDKETPATPEDMEYAFKAGANFALQNQWISVEDELPEIDNEVLFLCEYGTFLGFFDSGNIWVANGLGEVFDVTHWIPIPPLPEARKEGNV